MKRGYGSTDIFLGCPGSWMAPKVFLLKLQLLPLPVGVLLVSDQRPRQTSKKHLPVKCSYQETNV